MGTTILGYEFNGGLRKGLIGAAITLATALGGYVLNASSKVEPLTVKTEAIKETLDSGTADQREWNQLFLSNQQKSNDKLDLVIQALNRRTP